jgi:stringent starvation protein B
VLNVSPGATQTLLIGPDVMEFNARFGGVSHYVRVPLNAVVGIYARETGEGMVFADEAGGTPGAPDPDSPTPPPKAPDPPKRPSLKVVK